MKISKLVIGLAVIALFSYNVASATRMKSYDAAIKSQIVGMQPSIIICGDDNGGSYLGCDRIIEESKAKLPACSQDEKYNVVVSKDGQSYAIWADLINEEGYACIDPITYSLKVVVSDEKPTAEKAFCPPNGHYTKQKDKEGCGYKNDYSAIYLFLTIVFAFYTALSVLLALINKYILKHKFKLRDILWLSLLSIVIVPVGFASLLFLIGAAVTIAGFDSELSFFISLPFAVYLTYACVKGLFRPYKKMVSAEAIRNFSIFILFYMLASIYFLILFS